MSSVSEKRFRLLTALSDSASSAEKAPVLRNPTAPQGDAASPGGGSEPASSRCEDRHENAQEPSNAQTHLSSVSQKLVQALPADFFRTLTEEQAEQYVRLLLALEPELPFRLIVEPAGGGEATGSGSATGSGEATGAAHRRPLARVTVLGADRPWLFSLVTGLISAAGLQVHRGHAYTVPLDDRIGTRIVDSFEIEPLDPTSNWEDTLEGQFNTLFRHLADPSDHGAVEKARRYVVEEVSLQIGRLRNTYRMLLPVEVEHATDHNGVTRFTVRSEDTPCFLYALSTALSLHGVSITRVDISTVDGRIQDTFEFVGPDGRAVRDRDVLDRITLSIVFTKQFTSFLDQAPDPYAALLRFSQVIQELSTARGAADVRSMLSDPHFQEELAILLGTSDFIWEDFIRLQHESLLPMLRKVEQHELLSTDEHEIESALDQKLAECQNREEAVEELNRFKDRESFLIDLDHILVPELDFFFLSRRLTSLAEAVVRAAIRLAWGGIVETHGVPRTAAGVEASWATFGLGKLGGEALGYASDIELLFMYSDDGESDGRKPVRNREFFERLFRSAVGMIRARREGIFRIDLRLRPYGADGPLACKLDSFVSYYGPKGPAHAAERLALVRLRWIAGDEELGRRAVRIRDDILYRSESIDIAELRKLREHQIAEKVPEGRINAKFSPGGLVDLEYNVQLLQVTYGRAKPELRCPGIHEALRELSKEGAIDTAEAEAMISAYRFLRDLLNGMRMLRGNAQDLFLPDFDSLEFRHLARRIGYRHDENLAAQEKLKLDFEMHTAAVRSFVERHLGREAIPGEAAGSVADLVLSDSLSEEASRAAFAGAGFSRPERAVENIRAMRRTGIPRTRLARLLVLAWDRLAQVADPDMALNNWEAFLGRLRDTDEHVSRLLNQPKRLDIFFTIANGSQFLADTLIANPEFFDWITEARTVRSSYSETGLANQLRAELEECTTRPERLNAIRRFRKRHILRIGTRDICLQTSLSEVTGEISSLARAVIEEALRAVWSKVEAQGLPVPASPDRFCVLAFGKLGAGELNYSSDIDLVAVYDPAHDPLVSQSTESESSGEAPASRAPTSGAPATGSTGEAATDAPASSTADLSPGRVAGKDPPARDEQQPQPRPDEEERLYVRVFRSLIQDLTDFTEEGQAYRVDLRLRPHGEAGPMVPATHALLRYYRSSAQLWEQQALLKLSPVAGARFIGQRVVAELRPTLSHPRKPAIVRRTVRMLRSEAVEHHGAEEREDIKNRIGGIRDIEFLVQALQMIHAPTYPGLLIGNTLAAIEALKGASLLSEEQAAQLECDYVFLRKIEHFLQLYGDRRLHALPSEPPERRKLARCVQGPGADPDTFFATLDEVLRRTRNEYRAILEEDDAAE